MFNLLPQVVIPLGKEMFRLKYIQRQSLLLGARNTQRRFEYEEGRVPSNTTALFAFLSSNADTVLYLVFDLLRTKFNQRKTYRNLAYFLKIIIILLTVRAVTSISLCSRQMHVFRRDLW